MSVESLFSCQIFEGRVAIQIHNWLFIWDSEIFNVHFRHGGKELVGSSWSINETKLKYMN